MKVFLSILCIIFGALPGVVFGSENIRVAIADNQRTVTLRSPAGLVTDGRAVEQNEKQITFTSTSIGARPVRLRSRGDATRVNGKEYRGWIEVRKKKNGLLLVINDLDIEEYLKGVVGVEIPSDWEFEALKAQAVASRTYALYQKRMAGRRPYHLLPTVTSQVYAGRRGERPSVVRAVRETKGMVITYNGAVIPAFYHSSCGGHTEDAAELWGIDEPYLKGVDCDCQEIATYGAWEKRFRTADLAAALGRQGYRLKDAASFEIGSITPAGRVKDVAVRGSRGTVNLPAETLRAAMGYGLIPSVFFELGMNGNEVIVSGRGMGHGVGLCQWGAREMAQKGHDFKSILSHYYPGTKIIPMDDM